MADIIQLRRSATGGAVPDAGFLQAGELAINTVDLSIYIQTAAGTVADLTKPTLSKIQQSGATTNHFIKWNGTAWAGSFLSLGDLPAGGGFAGQYLAYNGTAWVPTTLNITTGSIGQTGASQGQVIMWNDAEESWMPASLYPSTLDQSGATTGQVITWGSLGWAPASIPYPAHTSSQAFPTANVNLSFASTWYTVASLTLAAGTWLLTATATIVRGGSGARSFLVRIASSSTHYAVAQQGLAQVSANTCAPSCTVIVTLTSSTTINMQAATNTTSSPADFATYFDNLIGEVNASGLVAVRIA